MRDGGDEGWVRGGGAGTGWAGARWGRRRLHLGELSSRGERGPASGRHRQRGWTRLQVPIILRGGPSGGAGAVYKVIGWNRRPRIDHLGALATHPLCRECEWCSYQHWFNQLA